MKLLNIFKKNKKSRNVVQTLALDKKQLEKVVGGTETKPLTSIQDESKGFSSLIR